MFFCPNWKCWWSVYFLDTSLCDPAPVPIWHFVYSSQMTTELILCTLLNRHPFIPVEYIMTKLSLLTLSRDTMMIIPFDLTCAQSLIWLQKESDSTGARSGSSRVHTHLCASSVVGGALIVV